MAAGTRFASRAKVDRELLVALDDGRPGLTLPQHRDDRLVAVLSLFLRILQPLWPSPWMHLQKAAGTVFRPSHFSLMSRRHHDEETTIGSVGALGLFMVIITSLFAHWVNDTGLLDDPPRARIVHFETTKPSSKVSNKENPVGSNLRLVDSRSDSKAESQSNHQ